MGALRPGLAARFEFDLAGRTAYAYTLVVLDRACSSRGASSTRRSASRCRRCATTGCARPASALSVHARLVAVYTIAAAIAGAAGALLAQTTGFASLDVFDFHRSAEVLLVLVIGGTGYLYGGIFGAIVFKLLHDLISAWTPQYWNFWLGLFLVVLVLVGRERLIRPQTWWRRASHSRASRRRPPRRRGVDDDRRARDARWSSASAASPRPTTSR